MLDAVKLLLAKLIKLLPKAVGINVLTKEQTETFLQPYQIASNPADAIQLPAVPNLGDPTQTLFEPMEAITHPGHVWSYQGDRRPIVQLPYGSVLINRQILCTNFGNHHLSENLVQWLGRKPYATTTLIAPWSHYLDGIAFGGYYDFMMLVAAQLCRMKDALPADVFAKALVAYPLFNTSYETDLLTLLGITKERIIDSRRYAVRADRVILGNNGHWFYPNVADVLSLKRQVEAQLKLEKRARNRIYISRAGRRRIVNEPELIELLHKYAITYVEDKPRSIAEQVSLYKHADFIMGPHGASFTNIIWCEPGTHLLELFSPNYAPAHFLYLATVMNMDYSAYTLSAPAETAGRQNPLEEDIHVSIPELDRCLAQLLGTPASCV